VGVVPEDRAGELQERLQPGQRLVSLEGGLWRWDGLVRAPEAEEAGVARLRHRLRLDAARQELPALEGTLASATAAERERAAALAEARQALAGAEGAWARGRRGPDAGEAAPRFRPGARAEQAADADRLAGEGVAWRASGRSWIASARLCRQDRPERQRRDRSLASATPPGRRPRRRKVGSARRARQAEAAERALAQARKDVTEARRRWTPRGGRRSAVAARPRLPRARQWRPRRDIARGPRRSPPSAPT
jgi:chromosome segregation protein